jgi:hypothetical protein
MDGVKFFKDTNGSDGFNGLAIFVEHKIKGRGKDGKRKQGWEGITAQQDGAGDGPYVAHKISSVYLGDCCTEIPEAEARKLFPKLVGLVEESESVWSKLRLTT